VNLRVTKLEIKVLKSFDRVKKVKEQNKKIKPRQNGSENRLDTKLSSGLK